MRLLFFSDACIEYLPLSLRYLYLSDNSITNAVRIRVAHSACVSILTQLDRELMIFHHTSTRSPWTTL
jgi:hypothetical protein